MTRREPRQLRSARAARLPLAPLVPDVVVSVLLAPIDEELPVEPLVDGLAAELLELPEGVELVDGLAPIELEELSDDDGVVLLLEPEGDAPIVLDEPVEPEGCWLAPVLGCVPPVDAPAPVLGEPLGLAAPLLEVWATA